MIPGNPATARVIWDTTVSLDGYIAGPGDAMDWVFESAERNDAVEETIATTAALLVGRRSYDVGRRATRPELQEPFGRPFAGRQFVMTHRRPADAGDGEPTFLSGDIGDAVATARAAAVAAGGNVLVIGADVARQCVEAGLVDEVSVHVAPVMLGDGVPLLRRHGGLRVDLRPLAVSRAGAVTNLRFAVVR